MNKEKCLILFCHEACEILLIDKKHRKVFFSFFYVWNFKSYNEVDEEIDRIMTFVKNTGLSFFPMNVLSPILTTFIVPAFVKAITSSISEHSLINSSFFRPDPINPSFRFTNSLLFLAATLVILIVNSSIFIDLR